MQPSEWSHQPSFASVGLEGAFVVALQAGVLVAVGQVEAAGGEHVELRPHEAAEGVLRSIDDRLAANIEAGVDQHGTAGLGLEAGEQRVETRVGLGMDSLDARRIVDM